MEYKEKSALPEDIPGIKDLLGENKLPNEDVGVSDINFYIIKKDDQVIGCAGLEFFSEKALLRSVAVKDGYKGKGHGSQLTNSLLALAKTMSVKEIYLLTTTAKDYFESKGFTVIAREEAPVSIKNSTEFADLCPDSSILMRKKI